MFNNDKLKKLSEERDLYRAHPENEFLQAKEFKSIAKAVLIVAEEIDIPTADEAELIEWAQNINR